MVVGTTIVVVVVDPAEVDVVVSGIVVVGSADEVQADVATATTATSRTAMRGVIERVRCGGAPPVTWTEPSPLGQGGTDRDSTAHR